MKRDDFDQPTKEMLAKRVGMRCSNPQCRRNTSGPREDPTKSVNVGVAAHITAAVSGGPRFDSSLSTETRSAIGNGIWLCQTCAKLVDNDVGTFTAERLHQWKREAEDVAFREIQSPATTRDLRVRVTSTRMGRRQLAQFQLYNASSEPIFIKGWHAWWGPNGAEGGISSIDCVMGRLPYRLQSHDAYSFTVPLGERPVEAITGMGVEDGLGTNWNIDATEIARFIQTAVAHRPPDPTPTGPTDDELWHSSVEIGTQKHQVGPRASLEVVFRNRGPFPIPVRAARIAWRYEPPRDLSSPGCPSVHESEGAIDFGTKVVVPVDAEQRIPVPPHLEGVLVAVLAADVADSNITVHIFAGQRLHWTENENVAPAIREVAQSIVDSWDQ